MPAIEIEIIETAIETEPLWQAVADPQCGAHLVFLGTTRSVTTTGDGERKETDRLAYQAYVPMAEKELRLLAERACQRFAIERLVIVHRLGEVAVGEASVAVAGSAPHRANLFDGIAWIMDELKRTVPIWKRETWRNGQQEWIHPDNGPDQ